MMGVGFGLQLFGAYTPGYLFFVTRSRDVWESEEEIRDKHLYAM